MTPDVIQSDLMHSKSLPALIAKLLAERQQLLVLFNRLGELKTCGALAAVQSLLQRFCQLLVDYMALGHFEVYQSLDGQAGDSQRYRRLKRLATALHPRIATTTQAALAFNDRYDCQAECEIHTAFWDDLSGLGEVLATRIELEDRLFQAVEAVLPTLHHSVATQPQRPQLHLTAAGHPQ